ncbi:hypothetical protein ACROYT_G004488 [Oculina patagonica]
MEEKQSTRFVESSDGEIKELVANAVPENTKKSTKYAVNVFEEARNVEGKPYSRNTMKAIRSGLDRFLSGSPQRKPFSIIRDKAFKPANEALDASLKDLARQGLISSTKHKRPISSEDLEALYAANQLGLDSPESLVNTAWFYTALYFGKRGRENQRAMKPGDLQLKITTGG